MRVVTPAQALQIAAQSEAAGTTTATRFARSTGAAERPAPVGGAGPTVMDLRLKRR